MKPTQTQVEKCQKYIHKGFQPQCCVNLLCTYSIDCTTYFNCTLKFCLTFQVLPSEKEMKQDLMNNAIYNEYNVEELESSFRYVSCQKKTYISHTIYNFLSFGS